MFTAPELLLRYFGDRVVPDRIVRLVHSFFFLSTCVKDILDRPKISWKAITPLRLAQSRIVCKLFIEGFFNKSESKWVTQYISDYSCSLPLANMSCENLFDLDEGVFEIENMDLNFASFDNFFERLFFLNPAGPRHTAPRTVEDDTAAQTFLDGFDFDIRRPQVYIVFSPLDTDFYIGQTYRHLTSERFKEHTYSAVRFGRGMAANTQPLYKKMNKVGPQFYVIIPLVFPTYMSLHAVEDFMILGFRPSLNVLTGRLSSLFVCSNPVRR
jgi:hypothetical protein